VEAALDWLCDVFGFSELWRADGHRGRIALGNGVVILADADADHGRALPPRSGQHDHSVMVKVEDVDKHHEHAVRRGARVLRPPTDHSYGERQYSVEDLDGHLWTFSQALAGLAPEDWGGVSAP
jgi:uncharacterized glyoxalase superfamily protein PhnB